jgi:Trk K+ transport system NAD-binding subunit
MKLSDIHPGSLIRKVRAAWRDSIILLREFRLPLSLFTFLILGSGWLYFHLSQNTSSQVNNLAESFYFIVTLTFLNPIFNFPKIWYLQIFYFVMPVAGIGILALGLADFGTLFFNRHARSKEWQMAVASTFSNHIVLIGLGHLGFRVVNRLREMGEELVVIEVNPRPDLQQAIERLDVPLINDDATREVILEAAGVRRAKTIILCTQNDSLNLEVALKARALKPDIDVVVRIFDDSFASSLQKQFGFRALSATGMAAPVFAASATNIDLTPPVIIEGKPHILARIKVNASSHLRSLTVNQVEEKFHTSLVVLSRNGDRKFHPEGGLEICENDSLAVFGAPEDIDKLIHDNR